MFSSVVDQQKDEVPVEPDFVEEQDLARLARGARHGSGQSDLRGESSERASENIRRSIRIRNGFLSARTAVSIACFALISAKLGLFFAA